MSPTTTTTLDRLIESAPVPMLVVDGDYEIRTANREFVTAVDARSVEAVCGTNALEFVPEKDRAASKKRLDTVLDTQEVADPRDFPLETVDGELRYTRGSVTPVSVPDAEVAAHVVLEDMTETKQRKRETQRHRNRIEALHDVAVRLVQCGEKSDVYDIIVEAGEDILEVDMCLVDSVQDGKFRVEATSESLPDEGYYEPPLEEAGVAGMVFRDEQSLICDLQSHPEADPQAEYRDTITVPIPDYGVFQAAAYDTDVYEQTDLELAELLASHAREALQRIEHETEIYDRQQKLAEQREKIERLHDVGVEMTECHGADEIYELMVEAGEDILGLDQCLVDSVADGYLRVEATSDALSAEETFEEPVDSEAAGIAGKVYRTGEPILDEYEEHPDAKPESEFRSSLTVPIAEFGVFQAVSRDAVAFDRSDTELVGLLAEHAQAALQRLEHERELEQRQQALHQQREQIKKLHEVGVEIAGCESRDRIYELLVEAGEDILGLDLCLSGAVEDNQLVVKSTSSNLSEDGYGEPIIDSEEAGLAGKAYRNNESILREGETHPDANPRDDYESSITVPIEGFGLFQAVSYDVVGFDGIDLELVELLAGHARQALQRLDHEQEIQQQRQRVTQLHEVRTELAGCDSQKRVAELVVETGESILDLDICLFGVVEDGTNRPIATSEALPEDGYASQDLDSDEGGLASKAYRNNESILVHTMDDHPEANPQDDYRSSITVPIEEYGIFQAAAYEEHAFDRTDLELVELLAEHARESLQRIEYETELEEQRGELDLLRQLFSRVFRHNVRNELTIIQGNAELIETKAEVESVADRAARILESGRKLTDHTDKAREVEDIVRKEQRTKTAPLDTLVSTALEDCKEELPRSAIRRSVDDVEVTAIVGIESAIRNGIENAFEHNSGPVTVDITSEYTDEDATLLITDDGAGIPESDRQAINQESESKLKHSSGVGLWLMKWMVEKSDGSLTLENTDDGARVRMQLPRASTG